MYWNVDNLHIINTVSESYLLPVSECWWYGRQICIRSGPCAGWANPPTATLELAISTFSVPLFSSAHHRVTTEQICKQFINYNLTRLIFPCAAVTRYTTVKSLLDRRERSGRDSWFVSLTCMFCLLCTASISVTPQHWDIWRPWSPSLGLNKRKNSTYHCQYFTLYGQIWDELVIPVTHCWSQTCVVNVARQEPERRFGRKVQKGEGCPAR